MRDNCKDIYSVQIDRYDPMLLIDCLTRLSEAIPNFADWKIEANGGGIIYGLFLNIDVERREIEICNQPEFGTDGDDSLDDVCDLFNEEWED